MRTPTQFPLVVALVAALLAALATAVVSTAQDEPTRPQTRDAVRDKFEGLRRAQQARDRLPDGVLARFGPANEAGPRVDASTTRRLVQVNSGEVLIARGPGAVCSINVGAAGWSGGCTSDGRAARDELRRRSISSRRPAATTSACGASLPTRSVSSPWSSLAVAVSASRSSMARSA